MTDCEGLYLSHLSETEVECADNLRDQVLI